MIGSASQRAVLLIIGMTCWYSATFYLLPTNQQKSLRWMEMGVYLLATVAVLLMFSAPESFVGENKTTLVVTPICAGLTLFLIGCIIVPYTVLLPFNILINQRARYTPLGRYMLIATLFPTLIFIYKLVLYATCNLDFFLRAAQDALAFVADALISRSDSPERVAYYLRLAAAKVHPK